MEDIAGLQTQENLERSFADESGTVQRYEYFARIARIEGFLDTAELFSELAEGGLQSAHGGLDFLVRVADPATRLPFGETRRNLAVSIHAETWQFTELYPAMADKARADGFPDIASWFETLAKLKRAHVARLHRAAAEVDAATELEADSE